MSERLKRILLISGFALVIVGMLFAIYWVFFRPTSTPVGNVNLGNINGLPGVGNGNVSVLPNQNSSNLPFIDTSNTNVGLSRVADGGATVADTVVAGNAGSIDSGAGRGLQYYDEETGSFFVLSPDGTTRTLMTDAKYPAAEDIAWSPDGQQAVLTFPDNSKIVYDFVKKKQTSLAPELNNFSFDSSGKNLVSKYLDPVDKSNQWLIVSKNDGTSPQSIEPLGENADSVIPAWSPNNQVIATYEDAVSNSQSSVLFLGRNGENLPSVNIQGRGFLPLWSPDGRKVLYSSYSELTNDSPHLYIMDGGTDSLGRNIIDLGLDTWANKCVFSQNGYSIYCAVPYYLRAGSGLQPSLSDDIPDNIYEINLLRGSTRLLARPVDSLGAQRFSIGALRLSADESSLFFLDKQTGSVQRVQLK